MHAEVRINDDQVARVSIHRIRTAREFQAPHLYRWRVTEGAESTGGDILHCEGKGWAMLLVSVLAAWNATGAPNGR